MEEGKCAWNWGPYSRSKARVVVVGQPPDNVWTPEVLTSIDVDTKGAGIFLRADPWIPRVG